MKMRPGDLLSLHPRIILLVFLLCLTDVPSVAQESMLTGTATYRIQLLDNDHVDNLLQYTAGSIGSSNIDDALGYVTARLDFNSEISVFYAVVDRRLDHQSANRVSFFSGVKTEKHWWQDSVQSYHLVEKGMPLLPKDYVKTDLFTKNETHTGWEITGEVKEIAGYTCVKATRTNIRIIPNTGERRVFPIIAWFCPEIPIPYGPKRYGGLPGLIFELQDEMVLFGLSEIGIGTEVDIPSIPAYERVTDSELTEILMKNREAFERDRGRY